MNKKEKNAVWDANTLAYHVYKYKLVKISNTVEVFLSISKFFKQETELEPRNVFSISIKIGNKIGNFKISISSFTTFLTW